MVAEIFGPDLLVTVLVLGSSVVGIWAIVDAAMKPDAAWKAAGKSKVAWIVTLVVCMFLFLIVGGIVGVVYLTAIRPKVAAARY